MATFERIQIANIRSAFSTNSKDLVSTVDYLDDWNDQQREIAREWRRHTAELKKTLAQIDSRATSPNGEVSISVSADGTVEDVRFTPQSLRLNHTKLGSVVLETLQRAQAEAKRQVDAAHRPLIAQPNARETLNSLKALLGDDPLD